MNEEKIVDELYIQTGLILQMGKALAERESAMRRLLTSVGYPEGEDNTVSMQQKAPKNIEEAVHEQTRALKELFSVIQKASRYDRMIYGGMHFHAPEDET